jgi:glycosyltransferase involved in cell wall biosynthesis
MIAVIMSVYAGDKLEYLVEALESLYSQSYKKFDIYIQVDGYIDNEIELYLDKEFINKRVFFLNKRQVNLGLAFSLNELLKIVLKKGYEYIARMDADDICNNLRIENQLSFMNENKMCDVVGSDIIEFYDDGTQRLKTYQRQHRKIRLNFATKTAIPHVSAFFRISFFDKAGLYNINSNRNEDQWLWLSGFKNGCIFSSIQKPLVKVRMSSELLERRGNIRHNFDTLLLRNRIVSVLNFNKIYFVYNLFVFFAKIQPVWLLKIIYKLR